MEIPRLLLAHPDGWPIPPNTNVNTPCIEDMDNVKDPPESALEMYGFAMAM